VYSRYVLLRSSFNIVLTVLCAVKCYILLHNRDRDRCI